jgi:hypothetical protein
MAFWHAVMETALNVDSSVMAKKIALTVQMKIHVVSFIKRSEDTCKKF